MSKIVELYVMIGVYAMWITWYGRCRFMQDNDHATLRDQIIARFQKSLDRMDKLPERNRVDVLRFVAKHWKFTYAYDRILDVLFWPLDIRRTIDEIRNILWDIRELLFG